MSQTFDVSVRLFYNLIVGKHLLESDSKFRVAICCGPKAAQPPHRVLCDEDVGRTIQLIASLSWKR